MKRLNHDGRRELRSVLKAFYDALAAESANDETAKSFHDQLKKLQ